MWRRLIRWGCAAVLLGLAALAAWIAADLAGTRRHDLRDFDGHEVARTETAMWRSYYAHQQVRMFSQLAALLRRQYHMPFWRAGVAAYHAARAAAVFQQGHRRAAYEHALPSLERCYALVRRSGTEPFDVRRVARAELEWWIVHRERARHAESDLERAVAGLQSLIYGQPEAVFEKHAKARAAAMMLRDARADSGAPSEEDWRKIGALLDTSWVALQAAVKR